MAEEQTAPVEQAGIPQLDFTAFPNQIFWLVIFIVILFVFVSKVALPRISGIIEARKNQIGDDLSAAEQASREAEHIRAQTSETMAGAKAQAEAVAAETRTRIRELQDAAMQKTAGEIGDLASESEERINQIRVSAKESISEIASAAATEIIAAILPGRAVSDGVSEQVRERIGRRLQGSEL